MGFFKRPIVWGPIVAVLAFVVAMALSSSEEEDQSLFSDVLAMARSGDVARIESRGRELDITLRDGTELESRREMTLDLVAALERNGVTIGGEEAASVEVQFKGGSGTSWVVSLLFSLGPFIAFVIIVYYAVRNAVRAGIGAGTDH